MVTLRTRLFIALLLAAVIPSGLLLLGGTWAVRELVVTTGTAGPWGEVAESGRILLEEVEREPVSASVEAAAALHREQLSESVRLSRLFTLVGERILFLLPALALSILLVAAAIALLVAHRVSRTLSEPVLELVEWTRRLGRGEGLPGPSPAARSSVGIREFQALRDALRTMESELEVARVRELERERTRSWSEMARRVAHDLRNPLTPMSMAARTVEASSDPATAEAGRILSEEIRRLEELARSFSQFGRPAEGPPSEVDLKELLEGLERRLGLSRIGAGRDTFRLHLPPGEEVVVRGHPAALERALRNLVANALDATAEADSEEPVEVRLDVEPDGDVVVRVLDRGAGLPPDAARRIWEPDFTTKRRGTGLGLPMVRQVVLAHGGTVSAANRDGRGAEFVVRLPAAPPAARIEGEAGIDEGRERPRVNGGPA